MSLIKNIFFILTLLFFNDKINDVTNKKIMEECFMCENRIFGCGVDKPIDPKVVTEIKNSEGLITVKLSDLSFIQQNKFCYLFKKVKDEKTGNLNYILDENQENGQEIKLKDEVSEPAIKNAIKDEIINIEKQNTLVVPCGGYNEDIYGFQFCFAEKELTKEELQELQKLKGESPRDDLVCLELQSNSDGDKFLAKYEHQEKKWVPTNISFGLKNKYAGDYCYSMDNTIWKMYPKSKYGETNKYGSGKFLTTFAEFSSILVGTKDEFLGKLANLKKVDKVDSDEMFLYQYVQLDPEGKFYLDEDPMNIKKVQGIGLGNFVNEKIEDVFAYRFYLAKTKLDVKKNSEFDSTKFESEEYDMFEMRRDGYNNIVLLYFDKVTKNWLPVEGKIFYTSKPVHLDNLNTTRSIILDIYEDKCDDDSDGNHFITTKYLRNRQYAINPNNGELGVTNQMSFTEQAQQVIIESYDQIENPTSGKFDINEKVSFKEQDQQVTIESHDQIKNPTRDKFAIDKKMSFTKQGQEVITKSYNQIESPEVNPISLWKVLLLVGTGVALAVAVLFGFNAWLAFITIFSNPLSIIIGVAAFALVSALLVIAHKTNVFKIGKLFASEKYKNYSFFCLREKENRDKQPDMSVPIRIRSKTK